MNDNRSTEPPAPQSLGISGVSVFEPAWKLPNEWFESMPRKFVKHTGIHSRSVATQDEVELAITATKSLADETGCDLSDCAAVMFTSPSYLPQQVAEKHLGKTRAASEQIDLAAARFVEHLKIQARKIVASKIYCAGYAQALQEVSKVSDAVGLKKNEFILLINTNRISRITDYTSGESSGLFGDMAAATMLSRTDCEKYPVQYELICATAEEQPTDRAFFNFHLVNDAPSPTLDGGKRTEPSRIVFSLDGMGIADAASRAMPQTAVDMLEATGWEPHEVDHIVPHQAGSAIVRLTEMKLRSVGFECEVVNGMTEHVGNVSSCSIPFVLSRKASQLSGNILCPVAGVGAPGENVVMKGCIALRKR